MGCTYKDNAPDTRETQVRTVISELREYGVEVLGYDPLVRDGEKEFRIKFLDSLTGGIKMDAVIINVVHDVYKNITIDKLIKILNPSPVIVDIKGLFNPRDLHGTGVIYKRL
jgi:UDP-N-acetyl-D-galactosamine dehydrogenase